MDFMHRAAAWLAGGVVFAASCASVLAAAACLPERAILQHALLAMQSPVAAVACALPRPGPQPIPTTAPVQPTPAPAPAPTPTASPTPEPSPTPQPCTAPQIEDAGLIRAEQFRHGRGEGSISLSAGSIRNSTACADADLRAAVTTANLPFAVELNSDEPQVLILHTHATESYQTWPDPVFDENYTARSKNTALNMVAVGAEMARVLNEAGVNTLQDTTLHDYPSYTGSYGRSNATVRRYLEEYPSIKIVLDVHRDAIERDGDRIAPVAQVGEEQVAQVMLICGCDNGGNLPDYPQNLRFAAVWEAAMEGAYPGLTRPVLFDYRYYNQDLTTGSLLIEVGGHGNTLEEVLYTAQLAGDAIGSYLQGLRAAGE